MEPEERWVWIHFNTFGIEHSANFSSVACDPQKVTKQQEHLDHNRGITTMLFRWRWGFSKSWWEWHPITENKEGNKLANWNCPCQPLGETVALRQPPLLLWFSFSTTQGIREQSRPSGSPWLGDRSKVKLEMQIGIKPSEGNGRWIQSLAVRTMKVAAVLVWQSSHDLVI